jgi:predicted glycoside hydrolase/deacetylase ChbG (UPF0249 family)
MCPRSVKPRWLVITADDFGVSEGVNQAVLEAHHMGVLTSASLIVTGEAWEEANALASQVPSLEVGLHVALAVGGPLTRPASIPTLVASDGLFCGRRQLLMRALTGQLERDEVARELDAQLGRMVNLGIEPAFINGDQHVHILPVVRDVVLDRASSLRIPVRTPRERLLFRTGRMRPLDWAGSMGRLGTKATLRSLARGFACRAHERGVFTNHGFLSPFGLFPVPRFDASALTMTLGHIRTGVTELMVHPAYTDEGLGRFWDAPVSELANRHEEWLALTDDAFISSIRRSGVTLATFTEAQRAWKTP